MGKKYKHLMEQIVTRQNIYLAYTKARQGKVYSNAHIDFKENLHANLEEIYNELSNGTYAPSEYHSFYVYEPKKRLIQSLPFKDRVVQHAINNIIEPIFEKTFYPTSFACRKNKGTHYGVKKVQSDMRRLKRTHGEISYLKMDFSKYFASIQTNLIHQEIKNKISDIPLQNLIKKIYPPDTKGIPVGNLLSQLFANVIGHMFDRYIKQTLKIKCYYRYMDDTVIFHTSKEYLRKIQKHLQIYIKKVFGFKFSKWHISEIKKSPLNYIGYRYDYYFKRIRKDSVIKARRKIKHFSNNDKYLELLFLRSWGGHLRLSDNKKLKMICKGLNNAIKSSIQKSYRRNYKTPMWFC